MTRGACEIELVLFDLGGVFIRVMSDWREGCERLGIPITAALDQPELVAELCDQNVAFETGRISSEDHQRAAARITGMPIEHVHRLVHGWLGGPYPGVDDLVHRLTQRNVKTACLTNTNPDHWQAMSDPSHRNYLPLERLTCRFASHLIGAMKPGDAIYEYVEQMTKVDPEAMLFFDDSPTNIEAARRRGWLAEVVDPQADPIAQVEACLGQYGVL